MATDYRQLTDFLVAMGIDKIGHTQKTYLGHLVAVYRFMQSQGCTEELCRAGMFHSIYGTERFQGFTLPLERRPEVQALIGERAERLAFCNCFVDRATLDRELERGTPPYCIRNRATGEEIVLCAEDFDDLCRVHLYDWLEQAPRSAYGWDYRRSAYRRMAERLGAPALAAYDRVFAQEPAAAGPA
jgi:hypothetical protein